MGSPIGAYFTMVTSPLGISPISRKCCLSAPSPPTDFMVAVFPIGRSFNVIFCPLFYVSPDLQRRVTIRGLSGFLKIFSQSKPNLIYKVCQYGEGKISEKFSVAE